MKQLLLFLSLIVSQFVNAQNQFSAVITDSKTNDPLPGVTVTIPSLAMGDVTDVNGSIILSNIPSGTYLLKFTYMGYESLERQYIFPTTDSTYMIQLDPVDSELDEVVVQTTRSSRSIKDLPTRLEAIAGDELEEKANMKPGDIKMLLNESTGVAAQQTSPVSGTANIRIQGLDGRYTQLLRDGMPLYSGFSGGLSIMQIAPLDLKQVELIKGSVSTLYGSGAIAGLVNLISKTPEKKTELTTLLNATSAKGFDAATFFSKRGEKIGATFFASYNHNEPYDPSSNGFTAIPRTRRFTISPKLFFYLKNISGFFGTNTTGEDRFGGDIKVVEGRSDHLHTYFEKNLSFRSSTQLQINYTLSESSQLQFKNTIGSFKRQLSTSLHGFKGHQISSFSELNYSNSRNQQDFVTGINYSTEKFRENAPFPVLNYNTSTLGAFAQKTFEIHRWMALETGIRLDHNMPSTKDRWKGTYLLPRMSIMFRPGQLWTSRISGGMGYKMPGLYNEEAEERGFSNLLPIRFAELKAEKSYGCNGDVNYRTTIGRVSVSANQMFFYTYLEAPVMLMGNSFENVSGYIDTKGGETSIKLRWQNFQFYLGYTFTDAAEVINGARIPYPLTAKHRLNGILTFEISNKIRTGIEMLYVSSQPLRDGSDGKAYTELGFIFEKMWKHLNLFINAENFTNVRQTRWEPLFYGPVSAPVFRDIYTPLEGAVVNLGMKIKL